MPPKRICNIAIHRVNKRHEVLLVFMVSGIALLIHRIALYAVIEVFTLQLVSAKVSATSIVFLWNFGARRHFIFPDQMVSSSSAKTRPLQSD